MVKSVLSRKAYASADGTDCGITLRQDLEQILDMKLPTVLYTNSKSLFDVITKNYTTTDKRLMINIKVLREAYLRM